MNSCLHGAQVTMIIDSRKVFRRVGRTARGFIGDRKGGVAIMFGLAFPVVAFLSLVVVDFSRASAAKQSMQETLDAAALIVARSSAVTTDAVDAAGDKAFAALLPANSGIIGVSADSQGRIANVTFTMADGKIIGSANGKVAPIVASLFLNGDMDVQATSEVVRTVNKLEIALVLDTTGSMQGAKITNLIAAAKNFVTTMENGSKKSTEIDPVKISVVPFSQTVKVSAPLSMASYNTTTFSMTGLPTWLDGRNLAMAYDNDIFTNANATAANRIDRFKMLKQMGVSWGGCVEARVAPYDIRETAPTSDVMTKFTPYFWPDESDADAAYQNDYLGDVTTNTNWKVKQSYSPKYNVTQFKSGTRPPATWIPSSAYGGPWAFGPNAACDMQPIKRLSTDFAGIRTHIGQLTPSGETNIPIGLMWGWHTLSPEGPFADGVSYTTPKTTKIIVLMTDGANTMNDTLGANNANNSNYHGYGYLWQNKLGTTSSGSTTTKMNERMVAPTTAPNQEALCANIKAKGIKIYTVGVGVDSTSVSLLTKCATASDYYYDVDSQAGNLDAAFSAIAGKIDNLRISH